MFNSVVWPKGKPPSDNPQCGFNNELCQWLINGDNVSSPLKHKFTPPLPKLTAF